MLNPGEIQAIRRLYRQEWSYRDLADYYEVSHMTIARIVRREGRYK